LCRRWNRRFDTQYTCWWDAGIRIRRVCIMLRDFHQCGNDSHILRPIFQRGAYLDGALHEDCDYLDDCAFDRNYDYGDDRNDDYAYDDDDRDDD